MGRSRMKGKKPKKEKKTKKLKKRLAKGKEKRRRNLQEMMARILMMIKQNE